MERDEQGTHNRWMSRRTVCIQPRALANKGRVVKSTGDGILLEFPSALHAVRFALEAQRELVAIARTEDDATRMEVRIAVHLGDIMPEHDDIFGDDVNIAARLLDFADPNGIVVSATIHEQVHHSVEYQLVDLGFLMLKNIERRIRAFKIGPPEATLSAPAVSRGHLPSIAVVPFRTVGIEPIERYVSEGITHDLVAALAGLRELFVVSSTSTIAFAETSLDNATVCRRLGVRYLVAGCLTRAADTIRMLVELSDTDSRSVIWTDRYELRASQLFDVQNAVAAKIAYSLLPHVHNSELQRALRKPPQNMDAYDFLMQGMYRLYRLTDEDFTAARLLLEKAIEHDPNYATAYALMAKWYILQIGEGRSRDVSGDSEKALHMASKALEHNASDPLALTVFGHTKSFLFGDYNTALDAFDRAIASSPSSAIAWGLSSSTYCYLGDGPGAVARAAHALSLSPLDPYSFFYMSALTNAHYTNGTFDDAVYWGRKTMAAAPRFAANLRLLIPSLIALERLEEAREVGAAFMRLVPNFRVEEFCKWYPLKGAERRALLAERLIKAGLPR
jgi:TolB-like protein/Tfp pilus assembly protein PilF